MAEELEVNTCIADLPQSLEDYITIMESHHILEDGVVKLERKSPDVQNIQTYCGTALKNGRPLNKVMVLMAGQSGSGKSTTINTLFNDDLCKTSSKKSETHEVSEYVKLLCGTKRLPHIKGYLSFVDVPGTLDVEHSKEALNLVTISTFRESHTDLAPRPDVCSKLISIRKDVYPNLVLITVSGSDERMEGEDSNLKKTLKIIDNLHIIDKVKYNLICVVTRAMSIACEAEAYKSECAEKKECIEKAVREVVGISKVPVIFIENKPNKYGMKKDENSDFYKLPDEQLSHHNLIHAMTEHFRQNDDYLGRLLCGWYFGNDCPEKREKFQQGYCAVVGEGSKDKTEKSQKFIFDLIGGQEIRPKEDQFPSFPFLYLGHGYCPKTETTKNVTVFSANSTKREVILKTNYTIPECLQVVHRNENEGYCLSCETREMYELGRRTSYGLEADVELKVIVDPRGRWVKDKTIPKKSQSVVSVVEETRLVNIRLADPEMNIAARLKQAIAKLPTEVNENTANAFREFFSKWGSHFIYEVWLGGCFNADIRVNPSTYTGEMGAEIRTRIFSFARGANTNVNARRSGSSRKIVDMRQVKVNLSGGKCIPENTLEEFVPMRQSWLESIQTTPIEIQHSFKLSPYYDLVEGERKTSLREATIAYLNDTLPKAQAITRNATSEQIVDEVLDDVESATCFPPFATVVTTEGIVAFKDLKLGTKVLTANCSSALRLNTGSFSFTEMFAYIHYDPEMIAKYTVFHLENGQSLSVSGDHLVFSFSDGAVEGVRAKKLKIGDNLICITENGYSMKPERIIEISHSIVKGVYSPLTFDGKLIVDGKLVSCYANLDSHALAHASMEPLRWWYILHKAVSSAFNYCTHGIQQRGTRWATSLSRANFKDQPSAGIHTYAKFLMFMCNVLPFEMLQE